MGAENQFVERLRGLLVNLPYDLKVLFEATTDEQLPIEARELAAGAVIYCLSPADPIPDHSGLVGFADEVIAVRLVFKQLLELGGDGASDYPDRFPEQFGSLDDDLALFRSYLGPAMDWLEQRITLEKIREVRYKGKSVRQYADEQEPRQMLYEDGLEFTSEYEIDDDAVQRLASAKPVLEAFTRRRQFEEARRGG